MHFTSPNTNFLTQGGAALHPCQGLKLLLGHVRGLICRPGPRSWVLALHVRYFSLQAIPKSWKPWPTHGIHFIPRIPCLAPLTGYPAPTQSGCTPEFGYGPLVWFSSPILYKYWLLFNRKIVQNNSPRWLETVGYYISWDEVKGNIGTRSPVNGGSYFAQFPIKEQSIFVLYNA